jgi:hypothetical protein
MAETFDRSQQEAKDLGAEFFARPLPAMNALETIKISEIKCRHFRHDTLRSFTGSFNLQLPQPSPLQLLSVS